MPNATYTVTLNDPAGHNYTWSFTTTNGQVPTRLPEPVKSSPTNSPNQQRGSGHGSMEELEAIIAAKQKALAQISPSPLPSPTPSPSFKPVIKKSLPSPSLSPTPSESPSLESPQPTDISIATKITLFQTIRNFFARVFSSFSNK